MTALPQLQSEEQSLDVQDLDGGLGVGVHCRIVSLIASGPAKLASKVVESSKRHCSSLEHAPGLQTIKA